VGGSLSYIEPDNEALYVDFVYKLSHPTIVFVVLLAIRDEDVVFVTWDHTCHSHWSSCKVMKDYAKSQIKIHPLKNEPVSMKTQPIV